MLWTYWHGAYPSHPSSTVALFLVGSSCWFTSRNSMVSLYYIPMGCVSASRHFHGSLYPLLIGLLFLLACWVRSILTSFPFDHTPEDHICSTTSRWSEWSLWFLHLSIFNDNVHDRPWSSMHSLCRSLRVVWLPFCTWCWALDMFNTDQPAMTWFGGFPNPVHAPVSMLSHGHP